MKLSTTIALLLACSVLAPGTAAPSTRCGDAVVTDWTDGRIDGRYAPHCYDDALDGLPEDVRAYSTAEEDIGVALRERIRETRNAAAARSSDAGPGSGPPAPLTPLVLAAALALGLAGLAAFFGGRHLRDLIAHRGTRPVGQW